MEDLVRWLSACLDEDDEEARRGYLKAEPIPAYDGWDQSTTAGLPPAVAARVLREIDSKRKLIDEHRPNASGDCTTCARPEDFDEDSDGVRTWSRSAKPFPCATLRLLATVYADRPGYQESWRP